MVSRSEVSSLPHRWLVLAVVSVAQLGVILDTTIVNIALPQAQSDLGFPDSGRQWIITAYALAFGSLLFIGGRLMNVLGERRTLFVGLLGFGAASAVGGAAPDFAALVVARALQGAFGALLMPATLAILTATFSEPSVRGKAFGIFSSIAGAGASAGLILGGLLTEYASWRWTLFVNLAFALVGAAGTLVFIRRRTLIRAETRGLDLWGTALSAGGLFLIVLGFSFAEQNGWSSPGTIVSLIAGAGSLAVFFYVEGKVARPILPRRVILDRTRGSAFITLFIGGAGLYATFLFLTFYFQRTLALDPVRSGVAFLPQTLASITIATLGGIFLLRRVSGRILTVAGLLCAAAGLVLLGFITPEGDYAFVVLPGLILLGAGLALAFTVSFSLGLQGVEPQDGGVASAAVNAVQQIGGSVGTALLSTVSAALTVAFLSPASRSTATPHGIASAEVGSYSVCFWIIAGALVGAAVIAAVLVRPMTHAPDGPRTTSTDPLVAI